jgi:lysophospholipase L1-like esterase
MHIVTHVLPPFSDALQLPAVLLIGDSHLRGYSENMKLHLNDQFQVSGYIKPGAGTKIILEQATKDVDNLLARDVIILSCGSNDIGRVKLSMVFNDLINFIRRVTYTNVILLTVPYRHDLQGPNIIFNDAIRNFNGKLLKLKKLFPHLRVVEVNENRHLYTKHGLHLNDLGKEMLSFNLVLHIFSLIEKENNSSTNVIALRYYGVQTSNN